MIDNTKAVYLCEQARRASSFPAVKEALNLWDWCIQSYVYPVALYVASKVNSLIVELNRNFKELQK